MMMKRILSTCCTAIIAMTAGAQQNLWVEVTNPAKTAKHDQAVVIKLNTENDIQSAVVTLDGKEIPSQLDDLDRDGIFDEVCFLADLDKKQSHTYHVSLFKSGEPHAYPARTFAELLLRNPKVKEKNRHDFYLTEIAVPKELKDPYHLLHHHGVAFENELIALRIYFDKRQTPDLYGKFNKQLELKETQFYTSSNQKAEGYGDDVLWVGNTYGLGAFRGWDGSQPTMLDDVVSRAQRIIATGPVRTIVELEDRGWKISDALPRLTATIRYTLYAGHRDIDVAVNFNRSVNAVPFSTGIINVKGSKEYSDKKGIRGCWGTDYPAGAKDSVAHPLETVGLGIYVPEKHIISEEPANKDNYAFVVKTDNRQLNYKIAYTCAHESFGYHSEEEWFAFLKDWRKDIETPIVVSVKEASAQ